LKDPTCPSEKKRELLESLGGHISLALVASHRFVIEQWRIEQLTLVCRVSAQIANVFNLEVLTRRVPTDGFDWLIAFQTGRNLPALGKNNLLKPHGIIIELEISIGASHFGFQSPQLASGSLFSGYWH
jgi:hypothetical protein